MADKQLDATIAAAAFQKQWFANLRRRVFDERQPYALLQADVPFELFDLVDIPAVSNQWWAAMVAQNVRHRHISTRWQPMATMTVFAATRPRLCIHSVSRCTGATLGRAADATSALCSADLRLHSSRVFAVGRTFGSEFIRSIIRVPAICAALVEFSRYRWRSWSNRIDSPSLSRRWSDSSNGWRQSADGGWIKTPFASGSRW